MSTDYNEPTRAASEGTEKGFSVQRFLLVRESLLAPTHSKTAIFFGMHPI